MSVNLQNVNGRLVTTNVEPPSAWTRDYEEMGGDMMWGPEGDVCELLRAMGINDNVQPLFTMKSYTGGAMSLLEVGSGSFYFYNASDESLYVINHPSDLKSIAAFIDDENLGLNSLDIEEL
ncbi:uncharacterized protein ASPGLDRAFT_33545 [Aspergillus glaucus CBS 516.65]|uniref:Uncharacterized protein n=1 Tax=Aspergillus glaucus CBS 516.65 TaxID=1160497 RepID=A0A1L9VRX2_ASPGL|nr:hypothetical protein ASPGLDRAFT_33545 [Aspergillus glaucus CBS 516.65]OJJ86649.1 hypothetical protein ASPGLDRAFT_33545 [Aspergillus glaucus CBS 516.65]